MEDKIKLENNLKELSYLDKLNNLVDYINSTIADDTSNPYTGCKLVYLGEEGWDINSPWKIDVFDDGSITLENRNIWSWEFFRLIEKFCEATNSKDIIKRIFFNL